MGHYFKYALMLGIVSLCLILLPQVIFCQKDADIAVFAGDDTSICPDGTVDLTDLGASISGDVSDGVWFTNGDGVFLPGNESKLAFSVATTYVPGPNDISTGFFTLILVSDDPDGDGPMVEVTDMVMVSIQRNPRLVCNYNLNIPLDENCELLVTPDLILANPDQPIDRYIVQLKDENHRPIPDNVLTREHIGQKIIVWIGHECVDYTCESMITVFDKSPPKIDCVSDTVHCNADLSPDSLGFPVHSGVDLIPFDEHTYFSENLDACTDAYLSYRDEIVELGCETPFERVLYRTWTAVDENDNTTTCTQEIYLLRDSLGGIDLPKNYDNNDLPALDCSDNIPLTDQGYPSPDFTGSPGIEACIMLEATFHDKYFDQCGASYKVLREWDIIDWCTGEILRHNQVIKVTDTLAPIFTCPNDTIFYTDPYQCYATNISVPALTMVEDCAEYSVYYELRDSTDWLLETSDDAIFSQIPLGKNTLSYIVVDACNNRDTCDITIEIIDDQNPIAICDEFTTISLTANGKARLFAESLDDLSYDNCAIRSMEVMKMDSICPENQGRGPFVDFCCAEGGSQVMVSFIVTDHYGNENTCMVTVEVEDKIAPQITCPSDLTISCRNDIDFENLDVFGKVVNGADNRESIILHDHYNEGIAGVDGFVMDNCEALISSDYTLDTECHKGILTRVFTAIDPSGQESQCEQLITIKDEDPLSYTDIMWPDNYFDEVCVDTSISPEISGEPKVQNASCADVVFSYDDQVFPFTDGACMKVIRTWTVIDWCQFDQSTGYGKWDYSQVLKFENETAPVINCQDTTVCLFAQDCATTEFNYDIIASDDCASNLDLDYHWSIHLYGEAVDLISGDGISIKAQLPTGHHKVIVNVEDGCGNATACEFVVEVKDCKAPTPYCISSLTTVLMNNNSMVTIEAKDFDFNSFDNCTDMDDLLFSFSQDITDTLRTIDCDSLENRISQVLTYQMWVTDATGNQDYCQIELEVQDNNDNCEDKVSMAQVSGEVTTYTGSPLQNVLVELVSDQPDDTINETTDTEGKYSFNAISGDFSGHLLMRKEEEDKRGINTLDIVKIQRHILGRKIFDNPYQIIASDVNGSGRLTGLDLLTLRKYILGVNKSLNESAWKFYDLTLPVSMENALDVQDGKELKDLNTVNRIDFIGIKMGDVDFSWDDGAREISTRSDAIRFSYQRQGDDVVFYTEEWIDEFDGMQFALTLPEGTFVDNMFSELEGFSESNYYQDGDILRVSWNGSHNFNEGDMVLRMRLSDSKGEIQLASDDLQAEIYIEETPYSFLLEENIDNKSVESLHFKIIQNPFRDRCQVEIKNPRSEPANIYIHDLAGNLLLVERIFLAEGDNTISIDGHDLGAIGPMVLTVTNNTSKVSKKIVRIK